MRLINYIRGRYGLFIKMIICHFSKEKDNSITIHDRNLQKLAVERYKVKNQIKGTYVGVVRCIFLT